MFGYRISICSDRARRAGRIALVALATTIGAEWFTPTAEAGIRFTWSYVRRTGRVHYWHGRHWGHGCHGHGPVGCVGPHCAAPYDTGMRSMPMYSQPPLAPHLLGLAGQAQSLPAIPSGRAMLFFTAPQGAEIYVNGNRVDSLGPEGSYVTEALVPGEPMTFEVQAELVRGGRLVIDSKRVTLKAGNTATVVFHFERPSLTQRAVLDRHAPPQ